MADNQELQSIIDKIYQNKLRFTPIKGTQNAINNFDIEDGNIYFATDKQMIWLDTYVKDNKTNELVLSRILMSNGTGGGSSNTGFLYADASFTAGSLEQVELDSPYYYITRASIDGEPLLDTLIINSNGWFLKVIELGTGENSHRITAELISSGAGGGSGSESKASNIKITIKDFPANIINGMDANIVFTPFAARDRNGEPLDNRLTIDWKLEYTEDGNTFTQYDSGKLTGNTILDGVEQTFNFGAKARHSATSRLTLVASENNSTIQFTWTGTFITSNLTLEFPSSFSNKNIFDANTVHLDCNQSGNMDKLLEFYWDDNLIHSRYLTSSSDTFQSILVKDYVPEITHNYHKVKIVLSQLMGNEKGYSVAPLEFEVAIKDANNDKPIIWLGDYKEVYYQYDNIQIPFKVYVSSGIPKVSLYKDNKKIGERTISDSTEFSIFEIVDFDLNARNHYIIAYDEDPENIVQRNIYFRVEQDPNRLDFGIQKSSYLTLNFDASGRSNEESPLKRANWTYENGDFSTVAKFENFNWYNNGWIADENKRTCLRISNGAKLSIPIGDVVFASQNDREQSHTFEFQFRVRNVQNYSNLIHNITRYKNDSVYFNEFYDEQTGYKTNYTNYDAFLANYFKEHEIIMSDGHRMEYDDLDFDKVEKKINFSAVACGLYSKTGASSAIGLCIGPQDAFFSNGTNTVNVDYVEDAIINLSAVYSYVNELMYIYINGVLTGVVKSPRDTGIFSITGQNGQINSLEFNSEYCDIDLYKIRFYRTDLNVNDIVTNFAVDLKDVGIYDQNKLAIENVAIKEYQFNYKNMIDYNTNHISSPIMPYIVFDTTNTNNDDKLSYSKKVKLRIGVEFVNTPLELAYQTGELETLAGPTGDKLWTTGASQEEKAAAVKEYYQHHCPSFVGDNIQMAVQGTSSEFYPRRNYKLKTKTDDADGKERIHIFLNKGPFAQDYNENPENTRQSYWYMDNYTAGTTKFTMKIDYMESSGTYNMGFANLVKNAYSKHPFDDLNKKNVFNTYDPMQTSYTEVPLEAENYKEGKEYWYKNHKGNWKSTLADELKIASVEDFMLGPVAYAESQGITKVLTEDAEGWANEDNHQYYNKWYKAVFGYKNLQIPNTSEYRTSVQGFRTLAFHKKSDGSYTYIGMYNMLLDKGSDEVYGFKPDKTSGTSDVFQKYLKNKKVSKIAECWEFENNSRTFCSFRDPMNRKDLSFNVYTVESNGNHIPVLNSVRSAPVVVDSFEYRYHTDGDILDYIMNPDNEGEKFYSSDTQDYMAEKGVNLEFTGADHWQENYQPREDFILDRYKNWEKAVAWVWSTNTDSVKSGGIYAPVEDIGNAWEANTYYIEEAIVDDTTGETTFRYILDTDSAYDENKNYYIAHDVLDDETGQVIGKTYSSAYLSSVVYTPNTYYIDIDGNKVLSTDEAYDPTYTYYTFTSLTDEQIDQMGGYDRLVEQCDQNEQFDINETYYLYDGEQSPGSAVTKVEITEEQFNEQPSKYYKGITVKYGSGIDENRWYKYDTKEYRAEKFVNELSKHFDIEYLSTYFVMTEVFECYDSRGKNAMFASWGPQEQDGDYIWYPIFYDIDTQLGINNTGIPSFEYNVDATEDGNYSTSDSVLWNNFYKYFKNSRILMKYKHLRGVTTGVEWPALKNPPLSSVQKIEGWYTTDPTICKSIAMRGIRPLIATNLDEFYKYITITNPSSVSNGVTGHLASDNKGSYQLDQGTYFYALQGDRSLSRQQFLTNRLEYIDSWLNQGNYARGGNNRIWGRVAANNPTNTSDIWVEDPTDPETSYWLDAAETEKRHRFDAEYWLDLTPTHSTYVTLGDDNEAYPSQKYDGINPVKFEINSIKTGVRQSPGYPEQLLYVYGINQMSDVGDMSNLYWQEFKIEGNAKHLTRLLLGNDGIMEENGETIRWHNDKLNPPIIPAGEHASGMPLLKEVNMCNIHINEQTPTLDLVSCEKLQNFRATGSNLTQVKFADGVALNTLYLPSSITSLKLKEARQLKNLLKTYPTHNSDGSLNVTPGLYIEDLFSSSSTNLSTLSIDGGNLGIGSFELLNRYYSLWTRQPINPIHINLTDVQWSPFKLVELDATRDLSLKYYLTDYHYQVTKIDNANVTDAQWAQYVANRELYWLDETLFTEQQYNNAATSYPISNAFITNMLSDFTNSNNNYYGLNNLPNPTITGIVYIHNSSAISEYTLRELQKKFPELTFIVRRITKFPTARFIYLEDNGIYYHYVREHPLSIQTLSNINNQWFANPLVEYGDLDKFLPNYDFFGWAEEASNEEIVDDETIFAIGDKKYKILVSGTAANQQGVWSRPEGQFTSDQTFVFYAIFKLHKYSRVFLNADGTEFHTMTETYSPGYGVSQCVDANGKEMIPSMELEDANGVNLYYKYKFTGWAQTKSPSKVEDFSELSIGDDYEFIAVYEKVSVYSDILDTKYLTYTVISGYPGYAISLNPDYFLTGKITLPTTINNQPITQLLNFKGELHQITHIFWADPPADNNSQTSRQLKRILANCFDYSASLVYYEQPLSCQFIGQYAFRGCTYLGYYDNSVITKILDPVTEIERGIFSGVGDNVSPALKLFIPGHAYDNIGSYAFDRMRSIREVQIGTEFDPCMWLDLIINGKLTNQSNLFSLIGNLTKLIIYLPDQYKDDTSGLKEQLLTALGLGNISMTNAVNNSNFGWRYPHEQGEEE